MGAGGRRFGRYGVVRLGRRIGLSAPVIGMLLVLPVLRAAIKHKGVVRGTLDTALDATPFIGLTKATVELFSGDLIKPRSPREAAGGPSGSSDRQPVKPPRLSYWR